MAKLPLKEFLELYKSPATIAVSMDISTLSYAVLAEIEGTDEVQEYIHYDISEVPVDEYMDFMEAMRIAFEEKKP